MEELRPGLWHWRSPHPEWSSKAAWPELVSSCAVDDGERLLLVDPLAVPPGLMELARLREPVVVLTAPWHERDTRALVGEHGVCVVSPPADTAADLMHKFGIGAELAGEGSPDLAWLRGGGAAVRWYTADDQPGLGLEVFEGRERNDVILWIGRVSAVVCGDTLVDFGEGLQLNERLRGNVARDAVLARLRPLLDRPVEIVLPAHGAPTDRVVLERALA